MDRLFFFFLAKTFSPFFFIVLIIHYTRLFGNSQDFLYYYHIFLRQPLKTPIFIKFTLEKWLCYANGIFIK